MGSGDVAGRPEGGGFGWRLHHGIPGQHQPPHHLLDAAGADPGGGGGTLGGEGAVGGRQQVSPGAARQQCRQMLHADVYHTREAEGRSGGGHDCGHQPVPLSHRGVLDAQLMLRDGIQRIIGEHHARICLVRQPFEGEQRVVRLHHHVTGGSCRGALVGEHTVGVHRGLGEGIRDGLKHPGPHAAAGAAGNAVREHKSLQAVACACLPIQHVHDVLRAAVGLMVPAAPVVAGASSMRGQKDALRIEEAPQVTRLHSVDHPWFKIQEKRSGDVAPIVPLVEEHIPAFRALRGGRCCVKQSAIVTQSMLLTQLPPKLCADLVSALPHMQADHFTGHSVNQVGL
mmetsp:Transcript_6472/g.18668  ORF Transcript_6472/g.18668 Transcript_6472/m.18668 type:complete len:341 (+) Transcript_6472:430-1452(+)